MCHTHISDTLSSSLFAFLCVSMLLLSFSFLSLNLNLQMSKVLDILEGFINFHSFTYMRLDGSTKVSVCMWYSLRGWMKCVCVNAVFLFFVFCRFFICFLSLFS